MRQGRFRPDQRRADGPLLARALRQPRRPRRAAGRQVNKATKFADKKFVGFYSFNPYLVQSIRWRFNLLSCGLSKVIAHWEKSVSLPRPEDVRSRALFEGARVVEGLAGSPTLDSFFSVVLSGGGRGVVQVLHLVKHKFVAGRH